mmetsp:Transcript_9706/g.15890  ORF Transcript_9706/g.15890 Transcript_9706/m.15890 type:complete len:728 (-) Transcript_9706:42-2225(-)|eukprot:CAMPEP_0184336712 /NCGR_PEP_ID=MMETSP1089-20130417/4888_1 /TAXON_ID=38269 ORGANISM="Gloeochaete wittrockiana, Strain SAG46.84" /NCGR_SAMPLE_ID=MMETSP1089 /ASSEMBLY_ACC=CAM_ASM_000445 /LENGTH=727 /DNA_ID=CAMNT_0026661769 /DNA_START=176 /DNA_END=2359 /DNA_ORIENTATION=-
MAELKKKQEYTSTNLTSRIKVSHGVAVRVLCCSLYVSTKQRFFAGLNDGTVIAWKARPPDVSKDSRPYLSFCAHAGTVRGLAILPEDQLIVSCSADRTIKLWDPWDLSKTVSAVQTLFGHGGTVTSIETSQEWLFSSSTDNTVRIWRRVKGRDLLLYPWYSVHQIIDFGGWVQSVRFQDILHEGPGELYVADANGCISVFIPPSFRTAAVYGDAVSDQFIRIKHINKAHGLGITAFVILPTEHFIISIGADNMMRVFDAVTGSVFFALQTPYKARFTALAFLPRHQEVVLGDESGVLYVWNVFQDRCIKELNLKRGPILQLQPKGTLGEEFIVTTGSGAEVWKIVREVPYKEVGTHQGPIVAIECVVSAVERADHCIYSSSLDNTIRGWFPDANFTQKQVLYEEWSEIECMYYMADQGMMFTGNDDGSIRGWNLSTEQPYTFQAHTNTVTCLTSGNTDPKYPRFSHLISGSFDGKVGIWDVSKPRLHNSQQQVPPHKHIKGSGQKPIQVQGLVNMFQAHDSEVLCLAFNERNHTIITGGNDSLIKVWGPVMFVLVATLSGHKDAVTCFAIDGNFLLSGSEDTTVRVWDTYNNIHVRTLVGQDQPIKHMLIIQPTGHLITCSFHGLILVWDYTANEKLRRIEHSLDFRCLAYNPVENAIVAGTEQHHLVLFPLDVHETHEESEGTTQNGALEEEDEGREEGLDHSDVMQIIDSEHFCRILSRDTSDVP